MDLYPLLKLVHILSATILFGTGLGTAVFMWRADRSADVAAIAATARTVVLADWLFTLPAIVVQPLTGVWLILEVGYGFTESWLIAAYLLYLVVGACWLAVVWLQLKLRDLAAVAFADDARLPPLYHRYMRIWFALGWPAFVAVVATFYLMVARPDL